MLSHLTTVIVLGLATVTFVAGPAAAQPSRCADCHFANPSAPAGEHLADWDRSPHGRNAIGCESCHRGDASTFESFQAHQGILNSINPASPVAHANLPRTCGGCHIGPFVAFQESRHFELLESGETAAPSCSTCHGTVAGQLPSPKGLLNYCSSCHGPDEIAPRANRAAEGQLLLEGMRDVRAMLNEANSLIERIDDADRRQQAEYDWEQAEVPLIEAANAGHAFVFDNLRERLDTARTRAEALLQRLANP
jgi:hypothetical protein